MVYQGIDSVHTRTMFRALAVLTIPPVIASTLPPPFAPETTHCNCWNYFQCGQRFMRTPDISRWKWLCSIHISAAHACKDGAGVTCNPPANHSNDDTALFAYTISTQQKLRKSVEKNEKSEQGDTSTSINLSGNFRNFRNFQLRLLLWNWLEQPQNSRI